MKSTIFVNWTTAKMSKMTRCRLSSMLLSDVSKDSSTSSVMRSQLPVPQYGHLPQC